METALNSFFEPDLKQGEVHTSAGNIYYIIIGPGSQILYYINDDFVNYKKLEKSVLEKMISENILKIKKNNKILWESEFKHKKSVVPVLNIITVKSPNGEYFNLNQGLNNIQVEDYDSNALLEFKFSNGNIDVETKVFNYSQDTFNFIICCIICLFLKQGAKIDDTVTINSEIKKIYEFTEYCKCENKKINKRDEFCKFSKEKFEMLINKLEKINDEKEFTDLTLKIWDLFYMYNSPNRTFDLNIFISRYLSNYLNLCNIGTIAIDWSKYTIEGIKQKVLLNNLKSCKNDKGLLNVKVITPTGPHHNILIIENSEVWKYEPNVSLGFKQKNMEKYVDKALTEYFKDTGLVYKGLHQESCGIEHSGLCMFISYFKLIYGNKLNEQLLKESIIKFFRWLIKTICSKWNTIRDFYLPIDRRGRFQNAESN
jgi:hypothetical protein